MALVGCLDLSKLCGAFVQTVSMVDGIAITETKLSQLPIYTYSPWITIGLFPVLL